MTDILKVIPLPIPRPDLPEAVPLPSVEGLPLPPVNTFTLPDLHLLPLPKHTSPSVIVSILGIIVLLEVFGYYIGNKIGALWKKNKNI